MARGRGQRLLPSEDCLAVVALAAAGTLVLATNWRGHSRDLMSIRALVAVFPAMVSVEDGAGHCGAPDCWAAEASNRASCSIVSRSLACRRRDAIAALRPQRATRASPLASRSQRSSTCRRTLVRSDQPHFTSSLLDLGYVRAMAKYPRVREQHIAVFGESGSGKTVLVSSFYGPTQEGSYSNDLWDLVADDTGQGNSALPELPRHERPRDGAPAHQIRGRRPTTSR